MANRKAAEKAALEHLSAMEQLWDSKLTITNLYREEFKVWDDAKFERWIERLEEVAETLFLIYPNFKELPYDDEAVMDLLEKRLGVPSFERLILIDDITGEEFLTPETYFTGYTAMRRQSQHLIKKQSIAKDTSTVDVLSGQVTGASKGGRLSLAELRLVAAKGLKVSAQELIKPRAGDQKAMEAMLSGIRENGEWSMDDIMALNSVPKVTETSRALLLAAHFANTLPTDRTER